MKKIFVIASILISQSIASPLHAEEDEIPKLKGQAEVEADEMTYLEKEQKVTAKGNVEVTHEKRVMNADEITYDQKQNIIDAEGSIKIINKDGSTYYADKAHINDTMTKGTVENLHGTLSDDSKFAASQGIKENEDVTVMKDAVYSPCKICKDDIREGDPLWQLTADEVKFDNKDERIYYKNATFDVYGVPVLYTPYMSHPTPGAKKKSGFLVPSYSSVSTLGSTIKVPYYINIAPHMDATITPIITTEEGTVMSGEFRQRTETGKYTLEGSITNPKERDTALTGNRIGGNDIRGHIEGRGDFDINDKWGWGFDGKRSTDDTYLQRYRFGNEDLLTSQAYVEKIDGREYIGAKGVAFQGLNANDDPDKSPLVLPYVDYHREIDAGYKGSSYTIDANTLALSRKEGVDSNRVSGKAGWKIPHVTKGGHKLEAKASLRADAYNVDNVPDAGAVKDGNVGRAIPQAEVGWSYPLANEIKGNNVIVEPIANLIASPNGGNPNKIPNEDSQDFEITDINVFSSNHYAGLDRVESGPRANYGVRTNVSNENGNVSALVGQNYSAQIDENATPESGMEDNFSDYVGAVTVSNNKHADFAYRFRADKDDFLLHRNQFDGNFDFSPFAVNVSYILIDEDDNSFDRQELAGGGAVKLTDTWSFNAYGRRDLNDDGGWVSTGAGFIYEDECIKFMTGMGREFVRDRDIEPATSYTLRIAFRNLSKDF